MSPQEQQTALQDLRESKRLELLVCEPQDIRRPLRPQKARYCMRLWSMAIYGLWQSMMSMVAAKTPHTFCCRFRHFAFFRHFCLSISTFPTCLGLPSPILRFDFGIFGYQVNLCPFCARRTLFDCVFFFRQSRVSCMGEGAKETGLQMFTDVYSLQYVYILVRMACASAYSMTLWQHEAPCLISCQQ